MIYTVLLLNVFSMVLLIKNSKNIYTWFFFLIIITLDMSFLGAILYIAKVGNYRYPDNGILFYDYKVYLILASLKVNFYNIFRVLNFGTAMYAFLIPVSVLSMSRLFFGKSTISKVLFISALAIFPIFYMWFYDPETCSNFYILLFYTQNTIAITGNVLSTSLKIVDIIVFIILIGYLFYPVVLLVKYYRNTLIRLKKMQIISLIGSFMILNTLFVWVFLLGPFKKFYIYSIKESLLKFSVNMSIQRYYFSLMPLFMLFAVLVMLFVMIKYGGIDTSNLLQRFIINRNIKEMNNNLRGVFHSFKNTFFVLKTLADKAKTLYGSDEGYDAIARIDEVSKLSLESITKMLNSLREIRLKPSKCKLVDILDSALTKANLDTSIQLNNKSINIDIKTYIDEYHFTEALVHVLQNAEEAIKTAGKSKGIIEIEIYAEQEWVVLKINDNGGGIRKKDIKKIYKPFYSTKAKSNNWGLGLSYVFRVVKAHLGYISVDSLEGLSTTFQIILPRVNVRWNV